MDAERMNENASEIRSAGMAVRSLAYFEPLQAAEAKVVAGLGSWLTAAFAIIQPPRSLVSDFGLRALPRTFTPKLT